MDSQCKLYELALLRTEAPQHVHDFMCEIMIFIGLQTENPAAAPGKCLIFFWMLTVIKERKDHVFKAVNDTTYIL